AREALEQLGRRARSLLLEPHHVAEREYVLFGRLFAELEPRPGEFDVARPVLAAFGVLLEHLAGGRVRGVDRTGSLGPLDGLLRLAELLRQLHQPPELVQALGVARAQLEQPRA